LTCEAGSNVEHGAASRKLHQETGRQGEKSLGEADESATGSTFFFTSGGRRDVHQHLPDGTGFDGCMRVSGLLEREAV
jgi:hypothetical protein